jgi:hypothetical protein
VHPAFSQAINTHTEQSLGYPVPTPVNFTLPFNGFRTLDAISMRMLDLSLGHPEARLVTIGTSFEGRPIQALILSDADTTAPGGGPEAGIVINGTLHAREWGSPEITLQIAEYLLSNKIADHMATYLLIATEIVFIPVSNPDGFTQTQRFPAQYVTDSFLSFDGRERRKNMNNTVDGGAIDAVLETFDDFDLGVDLNRNFSVGFGQGGSSGSPTSNNFRGPSALSEGETQAVTASIDTLSTDTEVRLFYDVHGAIPAIFQALQGEAPLDVVTQNLTSRMQQVYRAINGVPNSYPTLGASPDGAADFYFGGTYNIPSYTIEYPTPNFRDGGSGPTFILPDDELSEVVEENREALLFGAYSMTGPPILEEVKIWVYRTPLQPPGDATLMYHAGWVATSLSEREFVTTRSLPLELNADYIISLQFSKPMRRIDQNSQIGFWPGISFDQHPTAQLTLQADGGSDMTFEATPEGDGWQDTLGSNVTPGIRRARFDTWLGRFSIDVTGQAQQVTLSVAGVDAFGHGLDTDPATLARFNTGWTAYDPTPGSPGTLPAGGTDTNYQVQFGVFGAMEQDGLKLY